MVNGCLSEAFVHHLAQTLANIWQKDLRATDLHLIPCGNQSFQLWVLHEGKCLHFQGQYTPQTLLLEQQGQRHVFSLQKTVPESHPPSKTTHSDPRYAALNANLSTFSLAVGQTIKAGDVLYVLSAMKMQMVYHAPCAGTITHVHVAPGETLSQGQQLFEWTQENPHDT